LVLTIALSVQKQGEIMQKFIEQHSAVEQQKADQKPELVAAGEEKKAWKENKEKKAGKENEEAHEKETRPVAVLMTKDQLPR
uniref:Uncharacterized protein n=1 Tax=Amphimedon queenslandica TaxID=400682 RepID=A0A1X7TD48_AMPQE